MNTILHKAGLQKAQIGIRFVPWKTLGKIGEQGGYCKNDCDNLKNNLAPDTGKDFSRSRVLEDIGMQRRGSDGKSKGGKGGDARARFHIERVKTWLSLFIYPIVGLGAML